MHSTLKTPSPTPQWEDLPLDRVPDEGQLDNIEAHLRLVSLALKAITGMGFEAMLTAAVELHLESIVADWVGHWWLRQSEQKKLDVEEARSLTLIICHLAHQYHELIRHAVSLLEQTAQQNQQPHRVVRLGDYLNAFSSTHQEQMGEGDNLSPEGLDQLAFKLLIDLLFYSASNGHRRLWFALLQGSR